MKKKLLFLFAFWQISSFSQAPTIEWERSYGGTSHDEARKIIQTNDDGFISCGFTRSSNGDVSGFHGETDFWVMKSDASGNLQWQKTLGGSNLDYANSLIQTLDGGYLIVGQASSGDYDVIGLHSPLFDDGWAVKLSASGNIEWQKALGGSDLDSIYDVVQTDDGSYLLCGVAYSNNGNVTGNHGSSDAWIVKLASNGAVIWQKTYGGSGHERAYDLVQTTDGGFAFTGYTTSHDGDLSSNHDSYDIWIVKAHADGTIEWQTTYGGTGADLSNTMKNTTDGGYIICGETHSGGGDVTNYHGGGGDCWILKLTSNGNLEWQKTMGGSDFEVANDIKQTADGGYFVTGYSYSNDFDVPVNYGYVDGWVAKLDSAGTIAWQKTLGGPGYDYLFSGVQTADGGFIVAGSTRLENATPEDFYHFWILKLNAELDINSFDDNRLLLYPNPATNQINLKAEGQLQIDAVIINDCSGKIVLQKRGNVNQVNLENLAPGIYLITITSGDQLWQRKFVKL